MCGVGIEAGKVEDVVDVVMVMWKILAQPSILCFFANHTLSFHEYVGNALQLAKYEYHDEPSPGIAVGVFYVFDDLSWCAAAAVAAAVEAMHLSVSG